MTSIPAASKVMTLKEAIGGQVRPGMVIHAALLGGPGAAISEIIRQFHGTKADFTLVMNITAGHGTNLVHCGLVRKLIAASCVELLPSFRPNAVVQRAFKARRLEIEAWSFGSIEQRLMAGALGVPFMPTKSLRGSSMAQENTHAFLEVPDPFGSENSVGLVKALNPNISLVHGLASDPYGNTILGVPHMDALWGARAATNGVIVTVERLVSEDFVRQHSNSVKLPGYLVKSVSLAPFGMHPYSLSGHGIGEVEGYEHDDEFAATHGTAAADPQALDKWIEDWILAVQDHEHYLAKIGTDRLSVLRRKASESERKAGHESIRDIAPEDTLPTADQVFVVTAARELAACAKRNGLHVVFTGAGLVMQVGALARKLLEDEGYALDLVGGAGLYGYTPMLSDLSMANLGYVSGCKMLTDSSDVYSVIAQGRNSRCVTLLGGGQIDRKGNINTTKDSEGGWISGAGGGNDAAGAAHVVVVMKQGRERLVEEVPYISCSGKNVRTLVTDLGVFTKPAGDAEFHLTGYLPSHPGEGPDQALKRIQMRCGWQITASPAPSPLELPKEHELELLRALCSGLAA